MTENIPATEAEVTTSAMFLINIGNFESEPEPADEFIASEPEDDR